MHPNPAFRQVPAEDSLAFAKARGFGTLCLNGDAGPIMAHVPFVVTESGGLSALIHLARSNAIARSALPAPAVLAVMGPESYISPDWYGAVDQVPTWNYVAVHLRGRLEAMPDEALRPIAPLDHIGGSAAARGRYSCLGEWLDFCILDSRQQSSDGAGHAHGDISERGVSSV
jgi:transcriptional regulator